jgi:hypothetical protein
MFSTGFLTGQSFTLPCGLHDGPQRRPSAATIHLGYKHDPKELLELLKRIDHERERTKDQTDYRTLVLDRRLNELKMCAEVMYEETVAAADDEEPKRSDSMEPEDDAIIPRSDAHASLLTSSSNSSGNGINMWLATVASHRGDSPSNSNRSDRVRNPKPKRPAESKQSQNNGMTFYAESTTSGSLSATKNKSRSRHRAARPQSVPQGPPWKKSYYTPSIVTSSSDISVPCVLDQCINPDKVAIARSKRLELTHDERIALDWSLQRTEKTAMPMDVEKSLWEGADPNAEDPTFGFFFIRAAHDLSLDIITLLAEYGADITRTGAGPFSSALHAAVLGNRLETVQYFLELGMHMESVNDAGETPLHLAVKTPGAYPIARYLLEAGADVAGLSLQTVLNATKVESRERSMMVELLLAHGAEGDISPDGCAIRGKGLSVLGLR